MRVSTASWRASRLQRGQCKPEREPSRHCSNLTRTFLMASPHTQVLSERFQVASEVLPRRVGSGQTSPSPPPPPSPSSSTPSPSGSPRVLLYLPITGQQVSGQGVHQESQSLEEPCVGRRERGEAQVLPHLCHCAESSREGSQDGRQQHQRHGHQVSPL